MHALLTGQWNADEAHRWRTALQQACPGWQWHEDLTDAAAAQAIEVAVVANPPPGRLLGLPRLRLIQSLWAGVDRLLADASLPAGVPIARMVDPAMTQAMVQTALWAALSLHRGYFAYQDRQRAGQWQVHRQRRADEVQVLVLGAGVLGSAVAKALSQQGYVVCSWRLQGAAAPDLPVLLGQSQIVINLLPLTPATRGLLNAAFFAQLPRAASIVNLARGAHVVDEDLLAALASGQLRHAVLDVFHTEPLPPEHPFWRHRQVTMLPHAAALTDERSAAQVVAAQLARLQRAEPVQHLVLRDRGY
jgi:glyoxylate/hydroxypyruvate reductase